jgi:phage tail-like protein
MATIDEVPPASSLAQFGVLIDGLSDQLWFTGCDGLSAEYSIDEVQEGGNNAYLHKLPGRVKYTNVKLTRLVTATSSEIARWFTTFQESGTLRTTAVIALFDFTGAVVCRWTLKDVHPVKWTGPTFAAEGSGVAKETIELAHHGFTWKPMAAKPAPAKPSGKGVN